MINSKSRIKLGKFNSNDFKYFLAGFIEGEGSLIVSIKKHPTSRFGYVVDPEFFLYQHESGKPILQGAKNLFRSGNIYLKSGSTNVYVYAVTSRKVIAQRILPYFLKYVVPFSCKFIFFNNYKLIVEMLETKQHFKLDSFLEILRLSYTLNPNAKGKKRLLNYDELKNSILRDYTPKDFIINSKL
jgi:hypothetical protein